MNLSKKQLVSLLDQYGWEVQDNNEGDYFINIVDIDGDETTIYIEPTLESVSEFLNIAMNNLEVPEDD